MCIFGEEMLYNLMNINSEFNEHNFGFLSKRLSCHDFIVSTRCPLQARDFFMRDKNKCNFLTYTDNANIPKLCNVAQGTSEQSNDNLHGVY